MVFFQYEMALVFIQSREREKNVNPVWNVPYTNTMKWTPLTDFILLTENKVWFSLYIFIYFLKFYSELSFVFKVLKLLIFIANFIRWHNFLGDVLFVSIIWCTWQISQSKKQTWANFTMIMTANTTIKRIANSKSWIKTWIS